MKQLWVWLLSGVLAAVPAAYASPAAGLYLARLSEQATVTEADAVRIAGLFAKIPDAVVNVKASEESLKRLGFLRSSDEYQPEQVLKKGFACLVFVRALKLSGGLAAHWFGFDRRSAYSELSYRKMVSPMGPGDRMSGSELLSLLRLAQEYSLSNPRRIRRAEHDR